MAGGASVRKRMSRLGQKAKYSREQMFCALPLTADIAQRRRHVRFVPNADAQSEPAQRQLPPQSAWSRVRPVWSSSQCRTDR